MFPDDATVEKRFEKKRWPEGSYCPHCGLTNVREEVNRWHISVRHGTVMQSGKAVLQKWAIAIYMMPANIKGMSSMKIYRETGIPQTTAWFLMQRVWKGFDAGEGRPFPDPVAVDETWIGGKESNRRTAKKLKAGRGGAGKAVAAGAKDRGSSKISATVITGTNRDTLQDFVVDRVAEDAIAHTDGTAACKGRTFMRGSVNHGVSECMNGMENIWAMHRGCDHGALHQLSGKHPDRYVREFARRHSIHDLDTLKQMTALAPGMAGKHLKHDDLVSNTGVWP